MTSDGEKQYYYDNNGSLTKTISNAGTTEYYYNADEKLTKVVDVENITEYFYDYLGNRIGSVIDGVKTYYVWDNNRENAQLIYQLKDNEKEVSYTYGNALISQNRSDVISYYISDKQMNIRYLADENGEITDSYDYDAFGNLINSAGDTKNEFMYAEQQYDSNVGFYYLKARYMNPVNGNFISRDSYFGDVFEPLSLHKYTYAHNNPIKYYDPSGMFIQELIKGRMTHVIIECNYWLDHASDIPENYKHKYVKGNYEGTFKKGFIDIYNSVTHDIYEIKPATLISAAYGYYQLEIYKRFIDDKYAKFGTEWPKGEASVAWPFGGGTLNYRLYNDGLIVYTFSDLAPDYNYSWADLRVANRDYKVASVNSSELTVLLLASAMPFIVNFVTRANMVNYSFVI